METLVAVFECYDKKLKNMFKELIEKQIVLKNYHLDLKKHFDFYNYSAGIFR